MNKIKLFSPESREKIQKKIWWDSKYLIGFKMELAKNMFILVAFLYFTLFILAVWGYEPMLMARVVFVVYPVFVFATLNLLYFILMYNITVNFEYSEKKTRFLSKNFVVAFTAFYAVIMLFHIIK